jgi:hypothetical protein
MLLAADTLPHTHTHTHTSVNVVVAPHSSRSEIMANGTAISSKLRMLFVNMCLEAVKSRAGFHQAEPAGSSPALMYDARRGATSSGSEVAASAAIG